jgi:hypothetical protein
MVAAVEAGDPCVGEAGAGEDVVVAEGAAEFAASVADDREFPAAAAIGSEPVCEGAGGVASWYRAGGRKVR